ncbi:MAG: HAD family hydrolase [Burkholderiales bacterium]|nr:HAD family hydrolase [Burkholderiales bacterium]MDE2275304.1 HAD family hydrolase [Burkholderiales bacterium]
MNLTLFDLDGTLIPKDSDHAFGEFLVERGWADGGTFRQRNDAFYEDYLAGRLDMAAYVDFATTPWRRRSPAELAQASADFVAQVVRPMLPAAALALVQRHRQAGDLLAIVTATNDFVTRPIAALLGIDTLIATELERDAHGRVTGAIRGVPAFREGKIVRVQQWLREQGRQLEDFGCSTFYSDSINDLPLLERVRCAVATNPGPALARIAHERGWPVLNLFP